MSAGLDQTHQAAARSWVASADRPDTPFPIQNLPLGVFRRGSGPERRIGAAIGDQVVDTAALVERGILDLEPPIREALRRPVLNDLMALGRNASRELRRCLFALLREDAPARADVAPALVPIAEATLELPALVGDYTDFYASIHHATNVGSMFRPDQPLFSNYKWVPIGYHGRASSLVASGTAVRRPEGQLPADQADGPEFGPTRLLDYECEVGAWVGGVNALGDPEPVSHAADRIFGLSLVNDWSARDVQRWEYQPLGPFLSKSFATMVSPWVVTVEALAPFRVPPVRRPPGDPQPLPYLASSEDAARGAFDVRLEVRLSSERMRAEGIEPMLVSRSTLAGLYWTFAQMVAHHTSNGCNLRPGDLLASGTVSGEEPESRGCLLERTWRGTSPLSLPTGETRTFLADGDEVLITGTCAREGFASIGFGDCRGRVTAARAERVA